MTTATEFVKISPLAYDEVKKLVAEEDKKGLGLRLSVKGGGCSGLSYDLSFTAEEKGDNVTEKDDFKVYIDVKSMIYLKGMLLDYEGGLQGKGFVFKNPNATSTCGCGESFSVI
jgi:iron-sulfur cluster assembly protein